MTPFGGSGADHVTPNEVDVTATATQPWGGMSGAVKQTSMQLEQYHLHICMYNSMYMNTQD